MLQNVKNALHKSKVWVKSKNQTKSAPPPPPFTVQGDCSSVCALCHVVWFFKYLLFKIKPLIWLTHLIETGKTTFPSFLYLFFSTRSSIVSYTCCAAITEKLNIYKSDIFQIIFLSFEHGSGSVKNQIAWVRRNDQDLWNSLSMRVMVKRSL